MIRRQVGTPATWWALQEGAPLPCDTKRSSGHLSMGSYEVPGLKAWIADAPVNLVYTKGGRFSVQRVEESTVDPARRPRFDTPPKVARALAGARDRARNRWVLRAKQSDGSILAVMVDTSDLDGDVDLVGLGHREVGLLLQPPVASLLVGLCLMLLALPCFQAARRLTRRTDPRALAWASISRLGAACLLLEAAMVLYGAYRIYG